MVPTDRWYVGIILVREPRAPGVATTNFVVITKIFLFLIIDLSEAHYPYTKFPTLDITKVIFPPTLPILPLTHRSRDDDNTDCIKDFKEAVFF